MNTSQLIESFWCIVIGVQSSFQASARQRCFCAQSKASVIPSQICHQREAIVRLDGFLLYGCTNSPTAPTVRNSHVARHKRITYYVYRQMIPLAIQESFNRPNTVKSKLPFIINFRTKKHFSNICFPLNENLINSLAKWLSFFATVMKRSKIHEIWNRWINLNDRESAINFDIKYSRRMQGKAII